MEQNSRIFRKRSAILDCLRGTSTHPSAEMVHEMLCQDHPDISLATVYRNLALFRRQGLIRCVGTVRGMERFDANTMPHVHFFCNVCDRVLDLPQMEVPQQLCSAAEQSIGGVVEECRLSFSGTCQSCLARQKV